MTDKPMTITELINEATKLAHCQRHDASIALSLIAIARSVSHLVDMQRPVPATAPDWTTLTQMYDLDETEAGAAPRSQ